MSQEDAPAEGSTPDAPVVETKVEETKTFDADYVKTLRSENAQHRKKAQEAEQRLQALEERDKSEVEKASSKATRAEQRAAEAESKLLRYEVAAEKEIPADALDLLVGNTREELEAKAEKLLGLIKSRNDSTQTPDFDGGAREPAPENLTPEEEHNRLFLAAMGLAPKN